MHYSNSKPLPQINQKYIKRFWSKIAIGQPEQCWEWKAGLVPRSGYGAFLINYQNRLAHRVAFALTYGCNIENLWILHRCDNRKCCNPDHLFVGTSKDNAQDAKSKKRHLHGQRHPLAKLTDDVVREILMQKGTKPLIQLAKKYGVDAALIGRIMRGQSWMHITKHVVEETMR